ncbi:MAG: TonB-dependent receptor [Cryomorphaceae bacterium]|nr:TonB-dependent receptor [Cryomorphaceae bacterium]
MIKRILPVLLLLIFSANEIFAQEPTRLRGTILDKETREPVAFADVAILELEASTISNEDGYFVFNQLKPGAFTLVVEAFGFEKFTKKITLRENRTGSVNVYLERSTESLDQVEVSSARQEAKTKVQTGKVQLSTKEIQDFSVGGDADVVRAMQVIPGVVTTGDQGSQLYIRGGLPIQNLVLMDNMQIFNPFHSIGFYSVFDPDLVKTVDVYSAGFGAEYGGRTSAVMDVKTRNGNRQRFAGKMQASTFVGKLIFEGPLGPRDDQGFSNTSFILSAKSSYLDRTAPYLYPYVESQFDGLPFVFNDFYAKISNQIDGGSNLSAFGFRFDDQISFQPSSSVNWVSSGAGVDMRFIPPGSTALIDVTFGYSRYDISADFNDGQPRNSAITGFNGGLDFTFFVGENDEAKFGIQGIGYGTDYDFVNPVGLRYSKSTNSTELGTYAKYRFNRNRWIIDPGLRIHYYGTLGEISIEPRVGAKYLVNEKVRIKSSVGIYSQNLTAAISDREVVNLFYGFLDGNQTLPATFGGQPVEGRLQTARHAVLGTEYDVSKTFTFTLEGYIKSFDRIININRNKIYDVNDFEQPEIQRRDFTKEVGLAYGIDFLVKGSWKNLNVWGGYSWAYVTRDDDIIEYFPIFDRRHNLNLVGNYNFGENDKWQLSVRYNFGTGFPFTPSQGYYPFLPFSDNFGQTQLNSDYTVENGQLGVIYGETNSARLPNYHRLDMSLKYTHILSKISKLEVNAGVTNIANRENIFYFNRLAFDRVNQLPLLPTIGISYLF